LATNIQESKYRTYKVRWPIAIFTDKGLIEGEVKNITASGLLIHGKEQLCQNGVYRMAIKLPQKHIEIKGKLICSNLNGDTNNDERAFFGTAIYFSKISDANLQLLIDAIPPDMK
jgi:hypothetical protein